MLDSSNDTVAILYDIENAPIEMLQYTIDQAQRYQPCRMIVVSDWEAHPEQKRWERLMEYPDLTFRQISRTFYGKNSLDSALYDSAQILYQEGVRKYFIITTDSDFVRIAESLNAEDPSYIIGVGTKQASEDLRNAYNEFFVYPPEPKAEKKTKKKKPEQKAEVKTVAKKKTAEDKGAKQKPSVEQTAPPAEQKKKTGNAAQKKTGVEKATEETVKTAVQPKKKQSAKTVPSVDPVQTTVMTGFLTVRLPKTLRASLEKKMLEEEVSLDELVTYLLMRGLTEK
ncbi:NYN domain-containing protein [Selenomonas dianae]|uniref:NYN domain-containing protein n=2 Tax=Selenomonas dianae TaxID=135079 RepID=A0ABN0T8W3_9FIRM|nr:NYN domain-containing protein [Selenomonas dianae]WLD81464.1 NYN domain-containing protein [Selenomonas dianae]